MNRIEQLKTERDGLSIGPDLPGMVVAGLSALTEDDIDRLKWWGIFLRKQTPGHFMLRVRIPRGVVNAAQLRALGEISQRYGRNLADLTTRQQLQLRWIRLQNIPGILERLRAVGLVTLQTGMDNVRNIIGCPAFGLTSGELFDASGVAQAFNDLLVGNAEFSNLPRKFNVAISGCREHCTHAETQDVALVPALRSVDGWALQGFNVLVGGKLGSGGYRVATPLDVFVPPGEAARLCAAIALVFRDYGPREARNKARLSFLLEAEGEAWLRAAVEERLGYGLARAGVDQRNGKTTDHVGIFRQRQPGLNYLGLAVPVGRISGEELTALAALASDYGSGEVRFTTDQNLLLPNVPDTRLDALLKEPLLKVFRYDPPGILRGLVSCTGIEFCNLAVIETKTRALQIAQQLAATVPASKQLRMHWSGCPASCGNHTVADIGLLGTKTRLKGKVVDAVDIFVGGASGPAAAPGIRLLERVPCSELPQVLQGLVGHMDVNKLRRQLRALQGDGVSETD